MNLFGRILFVLGICFFITQTTFAQTVIKYKLASGESGLNQSVVEGCETGFFCIQEGSSAQFLQNAFNLAVGVSISVAVLLLIFQGTSLLLAQYGIGDMASSGIAKAKGKEDLLNPIIGLIIVFCSVIIIRTLNPDLLTFPIFDQLNFDSGNTVSPQNSGNLTNGSNN